MALRMRDHISFHGQQAFAVHQRHVRRQKVDQLRLRRSLGQTQDEGVEHICLIEIAVDHMDHFFAAKMTDKVVGIAAADHDKRIATGLTQGLHSIFHHGGTVQRQQRFHNVMAQSHSGCGDDRTSRAHKLKTFRCFPTQESELPDTGMKIVVKTFLYPAPISDGDGIPARRPPPYGHQKAVYPERVHRRKHMRDTPQSSRPVQQ